MSQSFTRDVTAARSSLMTTIEIQPVLALVVGILVLVKPEFLNYLVAVYLIVTGVLGLMG
jgi:hypothetical protein